MEGAPRSLIAYRLRTVRVGVLTQLLVLAALLVFVLIPSRVEFRSETLYILTLALGAAGAIVVASLPWPRLFETKLGMRAMYAWSVLDIVLISVLIGLSGGDLSPLFLLYGFTSVFFAASYPPRAQVLLFLFTLAAYTIAVLLVDDHVILATWVVRFAILYLLTFITSFLSRELIEQNASLEAEVARRRTTEAQLRRSEADLEEAQEIAHLGSWTWDVRDNHITWSEELFRIYDMTKEELSGDYASFLERVHEDDRDKLNAAVQEALDTNGNFSLEHRIHRSDGELRILQASGGVESVDGKALRMVGTAVDITERKRHEEAERRIAELQARQEQAVEINDNVVQGLAVASYALDAGDVAQAREAVGRTLAAARVIVNGLLDVESLQPGDLVRSRSARVISGGEEKDPG